MTETVAFYFGLIALVLLFGALWFGFHEGSNEQND